MLKDQVRRFIELSLYRRLMPAWVYVWVDSEKTRNNDGIEFAVVDVEGQCTRAIGRFLSEIA